MSKKARKLGKEMFSDQDYQKAIDQIVQIIENATKKINSPLLNPTLIASTIGENYHLTLIALEMGEGTLDDLPLSLVHAAREFAKYRVLAFYLAVNGIFRRETKKGIFAEETTECIMIHAITVDKRVALTMLEVVEEEEGFRLERMAAGRADDNSLLRMTLNAYLSERQRQMYGVKLN